MDAAPIRKKNVLVYKRTFDASIDRVWQAWSSPEELARWFGPNGFSITTYEFDFQSGGFWRFDMHGPDGRDYPNKVRYLEIIEHKKLVYQHQGDDEEFEDVDFRVIVNFEDLGDKTALEMIQDFVFEDVLERVDREYGAIQGGIETLERLRKLVDKG